ncbi:MAG: acyl carrier protein [Pseudomonadota bacterium]
MLDTTSIEERLKDTVAEFVVDWGLDADISRDTTLVGDLEFDSIDVIQLIVEIEKAFGNRKLGFQDLIMADGRYVDDLSVGQISDFLSEKLL